MACFLAPMLLAVITSIIQRASKGLAEKLKLWILNTMLWGGSILLAVEHAWHGELVPWPPFLTAMSNPANIPLMIHEIAATGSAISIAVISAWIAILAVSRHMERIAAARSIEQAGMQPFPARST